MEEQKTTSETKNGENENMELYREIFEETFINKKIAKEYLKEWYEKLLDEKYNFYNYIVYVTSRSYRLALIMEKITGKRMVDKEDKCYLTDEALFLRLEELAEIYHKEKKFPNILLCVDVREDGTEIINFYEKLLEGICNQLYEKNYQHEPKEVYYDMLEKMDIYSCVKDKDIKAYSLLPSLLYKEAAGSKNISCKEFLCYENNLMQNIGIENDVYRYSEYISKEVFEKINFENFIKTRYQNEIQYTQIEYVGGFNGIKAILTLRILKTSRKRYKVVPLVFLPNLADEETDILLNALFEQMEKAKFDENDKNFIRKLKTIYEKAIFSELIILFFSQALLQEFNLKNNIMINEYETNEEILKLTRCYNMYGFKETQMFLKKVVQENLFSVNELRKILENIIPYERYICKLQHSERYSVDQENIVQKIEKYFYKKILMDKKKIIDLWKVIGKSLIGAEGYRTYTIIPCRLTLRDLNEGNTEHEFFYSIAYILQIMDAGILSINSLGRNTMINVGFSQFFKIEKQAFIVYQLKMIEYIPMLVYFNKYTLSYEEFEREIIKFKNSPYCDLDDTEINEILKFTRELNSIEQKPIDWDFTEAYSNRKQFEQNDNFDFKKEFKMYMELVDKKTKHLDGYKNYLDIF